jgi:hypothetical protein
MPLRQCKGSNITSNLFDHLKRIDFTRDLFFHPVDNSMKILCLPFIALALASLLFLNSCANQATQTPTSQTNAAAAPAATPYIPKTMPMGRY